jgi:hypothetical protein
MPGYGGGASLMYTLSAAIDTFTRTPINVARNIYNRYHIYFRMESLTCAEDAKTLYSPGGADGNVW